MYETKREMLQRHVREGLERIERQKSLVARLEQQGLGKMVPEAREVLAEMLKYQTAAEEHLAADLGGDGSLMRG